MPERFRVGPEDYVFGRVLRIDTIRSSGPASLKVTWILASSFPVSFNEAGPEVGLDTDIFNGHGHSEFFI